MRSMLLLALLLGAASLCRAALDADLGHGLDLNAGVGRGLTSAADQWTLKFILGVHY